jgi:hypothetical protein
MSVKLPNTYNFCDSSGNSKPLLQLFDDKCFKITNGTSTSAEFCLPDFAYPADGYEVISKEVGPAGSTGPCGDTVVLFDNQIFVGSPSEELEENCAYARGIMLKIVFPSEDLNGEELTLVRQKARIRITSSDGVMCNYPLFNLFSIFTNPESLDPYDLINKIEIINPSDEYTFKVEGIVIFTKAFNG